MPKLLLLALPLAFTCLAAQAPNRVLATPDAPEMNRRAPDASRIVLDTSQGRIVMEMRREWSPHGVDRFYNLVRHGYYDEARFFRIRAAAWAQFGIAADPAIATAWRTRNIPDDPRVLSNTRGTVAYAFKDPNGRTTQAFINLADNAATHDAGRRAVRAVRANPRGHGGGRRAVCGLRRESRRRHPRRQAGRPLQGRQRVLPARVPEAGLHQAGGGASVGVQLEASSVQVPGDHDHHVARAPPTTPPSSSCRRPAGAEPSNPTADPDPEP